MSAIDFALLVAQLSTELSSGVITQKVIDLSVLILKAEVTSAPSNAVLIMLQKASSTVSKLQISLLSEVVVIKQQLVMRLTELKIDISTITFQIQQVSSTGEIEFVTEAASSSQAEATFEELTALSTTMVQSRQTLESVQVLLTSLTTLDFSSIAGTEVISIVVFMQKISQFMVLIGQGFSSEQISILGAELLTYKIEAISEAYITQLTFMMSTMVTYSVQVTIEVTMISSQMSSTGGGFIEEVTEESLIVLNQVKSNFESFGLLLAEAKGSSNTAGTTTAAAFLQISLQFVILIEQSVSFGFASIATQISEQIIIIQTMSTTVMPFSGKLVLLIDGMVTSINIYMVVLEQIIVSGGGIPGESTTVAPLSPGCQNLLTLNENLNGVEQVINVIERACSAEEFTPKMCFGEGYGDGSGFGYGSEVGMPSEEGSAKSTSIFTALVAGLATGLKGALNESTAFASSATIVGSLYDYTFEEFGEEVCTELRGYNLIDMKENLTVEIMAINSTLECDLDVQDIEVPPCANIPCFTKECMLQKIEGLFVNLNVLEMVVASIEGVIDSTCDNSDKTTSTEDFTVIVESLAALLQLYTPADLQKPVINEISGMIIEMSESTVCAADSEILKQLIVTITEMRLQIIDQITKTI